MKTLQNFKNEKFIIAIKSFFKELKVPINYIADEPTTAKEILKDTYKDNDAFRLIEEVYFVGMIDDAAFEGNNSLAVEKIKSDYDGIIIFGIMLKNRNSGHLPTRSQLAEISRAFNREFYYTPVVIIFKYGKHIAFANTERLKYKQEWREGEKAGKVSLLRDIDIEKLHSGHERILSALEIPTSGKNQIDSFAKIYTYWQEVFSVSILNKKFYQELSTWYFWATKQVTFPGAPTLLDAHKKGSKLDDLLQEHKATNVIRMLTRLLFVWFIKEKKLIPEEIFELETLQKDILNEISPYHEKGMFKEQNKESVYYKAILQNLFFATLNCPIEGDTLDKRKRGFRGEGYGTHRGIDYLMRYKQFFKSPDKFLEKLNATVPFLNGGLFECLDDKFNNIYIDGFSDQMTKGEQLIVPDYLFFGLEEEADISDVIGIDDKKYKNAAVKGLINILKSYKFTITENTPIEEDVALDPELLGKVFENLLASYNPETKTTARKQTGSFYTPREIVNYMVDESLIAYLKNAITDWKLNDKFLDIELKILTSFDSKVPFTDNINLQNKIITALSTCTILDPACGSGAFPMGILQKMVQILQKLDPANIIWKKVQLEKAEKESLAAFIIEEKQAREDRLVEINEAFDQSINDSDYARKLFLIENCIYGVDIQPIATQISKLRFFISLVVEQKVNPQKVNFGIRPLPNLETKFVAANTLIGIEKPKSGKQLHIYNTENLKKLELELKIIRSKLFSARSKDTKLKYRQQDEVLRNLVATELEKSGWENTSSQKLASWDPYDQNTSSSFFDQEWMFDIKEGFDIIIGNPPYIKEYTDKTVFDELRHSPYYQGKMDLWYLFACIGLDLLKINGNLCFIATNNWTTNTGASKLRHKIITEGKINQILDFGSYMIFDSADIQTMIMLISKSKNNDNYIFDLRKINGKNALIKNVVDIMNSTKTIDNEFLNPNILKTKEINKTLTFASSEKDIILQKIKNKGNFILDEKNEIAQGIVLPQDVLNKKTKTVLGANFQVGQSVFVLKKEEVNILVLNKSEKELIKPYYTTNQIQKWIAKPDIEEWIIYTNSKFKNPENIKPFPNIKKHLDQFTSIITSCNKPYGLHRAREEKFFKGEKIIALRKCVGEPKFTYTDFDCYVSATFYIIKTNRLNQKFLVALLNSKLIAFWLRNKGKMQGNNYQLDKEPLLEIPIVDPIKLIQDFIANKVDSLIKHKCEESSTVEIEQTIDFIIYKLYDLMYDDVKIIDPNFNIKRGEYEEFKTITQFTNENEIQDI